MKILDEIKKRFFRTGQVLSWRGLTPFFDWGFCTHKFASLVWYNVCDILTDLTEDVKLTNTAKVSDVELQREIDRKFAAFNAFFYEFGKLILQRLFDEGFVVIGYSPKTNLFWQMQRNEYRTPSNEEATIVVPYDESVKVYVMKSSTYVMYKKSDRELCKGFLDFIDDVMNGSATVSKRLGAVVVASPKNLNNAPTAIVLTDEQKKKIEKDMREEYGALSNQSNMMLLPREMNFQTIILAGLDLKMQEKVKTAILALVDRIKIPANQVAFIDAQSSKALANGGEIREGDKLKYKSFRRLFERTFADMARYYMIKMEYTIDGEPLDEQETNITNLNTDLLGVLTTDEKRNALGYDSKGSSNETVLAQTLGVGGTQSLVAIAQSADLTNEEKQGYLKVLFGLTEEQAEMLAPSKIETA